MIPKYTRTSLVWGISGLVLQTICYGLLKSLEVEHDTRLAAPHDWVAWALLGGLVVGTVLFILGLCDYAKAKGYSGFLGLLGFCSWPGLVIVAILPDRTKK
jgi:hypothetical protein